MKNKGTPKSLSRIINTFYIVFLTIIIFFSIGYAAVTTSQEVANTTYNNVENNLQDKHNVLSRSFDQLFEQLVNLNNNPNLLEVINADSEALSSAVSMNETIKDLYYRFQDVLSSIYINVNNGEFFFNGGTINQNLSGVDYQSFFAYSTADSNYFWLDAAENPFSSKDEAIISLGKVIGDENSEASGVILFNLKSEWIEELLQDGYVTEHGQLFLISENNHAYPIEEGLDTKFFNKIKENRQEIRSSSVLYHTVSETFTLNNWRLAAVFPDRDLHGNMGNYLTLALTMIAFLFVAGTVMMVVVGRFISKPIQQLAGEIEDTSITEETKELVPERQQFAEIMTLYDSFNKMIRKNELLLEENRHGFEERNRLEIELLQSQINPHFLYNTLYSIQALSDMKMSDDASQMAQALANFYRQGIGDGKVIVSLADELEHLRSYLMIMEYRYEDRFTYGIEVISPEALEARIPKISLQPVIENSIYHGIKEMTGVGQLKVKVQIVEEDVLITITDNGKGISADKVQQLNVEINQPAGEERQLSGIGLRSVNLRIKRYFGSAYGLWLEHVESGAVVKITIPREKAEGGDHDEEETFTGRR